LLKEGNKINHPQHHCTGLHPGKKQEEKGKHDI
jgi:hypothetical protein